MDVKALRMEGLSIKNIARQSGLSRNTVRRVLRGEHSLRLGHRARGSKLDAFKPYVRERFEQYGLSAVRLHAELVGMGFEGSEQTVRSYLAGLRAPARRLTELTLRYETPPGKQAQADWSECGRFEWAGKRFTVYAFVMVLSYSRMRFVRLTTSMRLAELIACHQAAFEYFGGWPKEGKWGQTRFSRGAISQYDLRQIRESSHKGWALGSDRFKRQVEALSQRRAVSKGVGRPKKGVDFLLSKNS